VLFSLGDIDVPAYPRSSLKPIQALPMVESGAADAFGLGDEEIALACASHSGEPMHTDRVASWLARLGLGESDLACGPHPPRYEPVWEDMVRRGEKPSRIHNNCSGKHAGFLTLANTGTFPLSATSAAITPCSRRSQKRSANWPRSPANCHGRRWLRGAEFCHPSRGVCARARAIGDTGRAFRAERACLGSYRQSNDGGIRSLWLERRASAPR